MSVLVYGTTGQVYAALGLNEWQLSTAGLLPERFLGTAQEFTFPLLPDALRREFDGPILIDKSTRHTYAFINTEGRLCLLDLQYQQTNPGKWIFSLVEGLELDPSEQKLYVLSNIVLPLKEPQPDNPYQEVTDSAISRFIEQLKSPLAELFFQLALPAGAYEFVINPRCSLFDYISQPISHLQDNSALLNLLLHPAPASSSSVPTDGLQAFINQHDLLALLSRWQARPEQMVLVLRREGNFYQWVTANPDAHENVKAWALLLNTPNSWTAFEDLRQNEPFMTAITQHPLLGRCLADLLNAGRPVDDLIAISTNANWYAAVNLLTQIGFYDFKLTDFTPDTLQALAKLQQFLQSQRCLLAPNPQLMKIAAHVIACMRNPARGAHSTAELVQEHVIANMGELFVPLFGQVCNIVHNAPADEPNILCRVITLFNTVHPLQKDRAAIYREALGWASSSPELLNLNDEQLVRLLQALAACRGAGIDRDTLSLWHLATNTALINAIVTLAKTDYLQQLLAQPEAQRSQTAIALQQACHDHIHAQDRDKYIRLIFEPTPGAENFIYTLAYSTREVNNMLMESLYSQCTQAPDPYADNSRHPEDSALSSLCTNLNTLTSMDFTADARQLFVRKTPEGNRFRRAMNAVERGCERIQTHLQAVAAGSTKIQVFNERVVSYRQAMYQAVYKELGRQNEPSTLAVDIANAEAPLRNHLSVDRQYLLRLCMQILANIGAAVIGVFSCFELNKRHERTTGHFWFFAEATSAEMLGETGLEVGGIMAVA